MAALLAVAILMAGRIPACARGGARLPPVKLRAAAAAVVLTLLVGAAAARGAAARATDGTVRITIHYSTFEPAELAVEPGETVRFVIVNTDPIDHEFILGDAEVQRVHEEGTEAPSPRGPERSPCRRGDRRDDLHVPEDRRLADLRLPPRPLRLRHARHVTVG